MGELQTKVRAKVANVEFADFVPSGAATVGKKRFAGREVPASFPGSNANIIYLGEDNELLEPVLWSYGARNSLSRMDIDSPYAAEPCTKRVNALLAQRYALIEAAKVRRVSHPRIRARKYSA